MKSRDALGVFRHITVLHQWAGGTCRTCKAAAPDHMRSCLIAEALDATSAKDGCPRCFAGGLEVHAPQCPKAAKA